MIETQEARNIHFSLKQPLPLHHNEIWTSFKTHHKSTLQISNHHSLKLLHQQHSTLTYLLIQQVWIYVYIFARVCVVTLTNYLAPQICSV